MKQIVSKTRVVAGLSYWIGLIWIFSKQFKYPGMSSILLLLYLEKSIIQYDIMFCGAFIKPIYSQIGGHFVKKFWSYYLQKGIILSVIRHEVSDDKLN